MFAVFTAMWSLSHIDWCLTNGVLEGINNKIQLAKRRARGYRDVRNYINMIYLKEGEKPIRQDRMIQLTDRLFARSFYQEAHQVQKTIHSCYILENRRI